MSGSPNSIGSSPGAVEPRESRSRLRSRRRDCKDYSPPSPQGNLKGFSLWRRWAYSPYSPYVLTVDWTDSPVARLPRGNFQYYLDSPTSPLSLRKLAWSGGSLPSLRLQLSCRFGTLFSQALLVPSGDGTWGLPFPNGGSPWDSFGPGLSRLPSLLLFCENNLLTILTFWVEIKG